MDLRKSPSRRQVLKSLGASASVPLLAQTVSAARTKQELFAKARTAFHNQKPAKAKKLFQKAGVDCQIRSDSMTEKAPTRSGSEMNESGGITTQDYFGENDSTIYFAGAGDINNPNQSILMLSWDIKGGGGAPDAPYPKDVAGIAWEDSEYGFVAESIRHSATAYFSNGETKSVPITLDSPPLRGKGSENGVVVALSDYVNLRQGGPDPNADRVKGHLDINIRDQEPDSKGFASGQYTHIWSFGGLARFSPLPAVALTRAGFGFTVNIPVEAGKWKLYEGMDLPA
jgi:hypothetical protein